MTPFNRYEFINAEGVTSTMVWVPRFRAGFALSEAAGSVTIGGGVGDWIPEQRLDVAVLGSEDVAVHEMGGFYADLYLCSARDATATSRGSATPFVSHPMVCPMVDITIDVFRDGLRTRFDGGAFAHGPVAGQGGLMPDAIWNEIWTYARLHGAVFHGNSDHGHFWADPSETGTPDPTTAHGTLTGSGPESWRIPLDDFNGNRAEFTDGLRLRDGEILTAGRKVHPDLDPTSDDWVATGCRITGVEPYSSVQAYRSEPLLRPHGIGSIGGPAGTGPMHGQALFHTDCGERIADRGSGWTLAELGPGKLSLGKGPDGFGDRCAGRAVFVPDDPAHVPPDALATP